MTLTEAEIKMSAPLKAIDGNPDLPTLMTDLAASARAAARVLALASPEQKNQALEAIEFGVRLQRCGRGRVVVHGSPSPGGGAVCILRLPRSWGAPVQSRPNP